MRINISPRQLEVFVSLANTLSFTRTAEMFYVTQPSLSKLVKEMEAQLGVRLFERTTREVRLTEVGSAVLSIAERLSLDFDAGLTQLEQIAQQRLPVLKVAALPSIAAALLPNIVARLQREIEQVQIRIHDVVMDAALELLRARKVDVALGTSVSVDSDLECRTLFKDPFVLFARRDMMPALTKWSPEALDALPLVAMPRGTGSRQAVDSAFVNAGEAFRPLIELRDINAIVQFARAGCGIALLPRLATQMFPIEDMAVKTLPGAPVRTISAFTRRGVELPDIAARLVRELGAMTAPNP